MIEHRRLFNSLTIPSRTEPNRTGPRLTAPHRTEPNNYAADHLTEI